MKALLREPPTGIAAYPAGIHADVPADVYHRRELGVVNKGALDQLAKTPAHYRAWVDGAEQEEAPALLFGRALHALVLEPDVFAREWAVRPDFGDLRTKAGKEARDAWQASHHGVQLLTADDWHKAHAMREAVMRHPVAGKLFTGGQAEATAVWTDPEHGLLCKARMDYYLPARGLVVDLKSTEDASPAGFARSVASYRYHVQHAHYASAFAATGHELRAFLFVAVEKSAPHAVAVYAIDAEAEGRGIELRDRQMASLNECLKHNAWPSYPAGINRLSLPVWSLRD